MNLLTDSDRAEVDALGAQIRNRQPQCTGGGCQQGRRPCISRQACGLPLEDDTDAATEFIDDIKSAAPWAGVVFLVFIALSAGYFVGY
jgi:hypothetical protein